MNYINSYTDLNDLIISFDKDIDNILSELGNISYHDEILFARDASILVSAWLGDENILIIKKNIIEGYKCCLIRGINFSKQDPSLAKKFLVGLVGALGNPTYTDEVGKLVAWDVTPRKELYLKNTTFSQRDGEAEVHTDSQYYPSPEKYIMLACHHKARDGGNTLLLDGNSLFKDIKAQNPDLFYQLTNLKVPFRVPSSFTRSGTDDSIELYFTSIFSKEILIRYRKETIEKGCVFLSKKDKTKFSQLVSDIELYLCQNERILEFGLEDNDIFICNNHEYLHGRTHFTDPERLLFRIRFN